MEVVKKTFKGMLPPAESPRTRRAKRRSVASGPSPKRQRLRQIEMLEQELSDNNTSGGYNAGLFTGPEF